MDLPATDYAPAWGIRQSIGLAITVDRFGTITFWREWKRDVWLPLDSPLLEGSALQTRS